MSIHSDAVFNRCHPARRWSGSSSASRRRRATTRCSKAYRQLRTRLARSTPFLAGVLLFVPATLAAQTPQASSPAAAKNPEVVNLTLKGVKVVRKDELATNIYTTASYCNSFILKPFCWISKSKNFYTRKYLDHKELERDVLRIRIFYWKRGYRETEVDTAVVPRGHNQVGVTFTIKEGPPTTVSNITVRQATPLLSKREIDRRVVLGNNGPLNLIRLDSSRVFLQQSLFDKGYADAEVDTSVVIDTTARSAVVTLTLNPKYVTTVEDIVVTGNDDVSERTIRKSLTFHIGELFRRSEMLR